MSHGKTSTQAKNVGFIDIGTNSIRLALVQIAPNGATTILSEQKETVRLGEGEFDDNCLQDAAIERAVLVCQQFAEMARSNNAKEIFAVATSATREAKNKNEFINALHRAAKLNVKTISGIEEARLIYLGISDGFALEDNNALMIDIGGGSTELIVGNKSEYLQLESTKLGAIRVSSMFFDPQDISAVSPEKFEKVQQYIRNTAIRPLQRINAFPFSIAIGSSGTAENLADVTIQRMFGRSYQAGDIVPTAELRTTIEQLCQLPQEERAKTPGLNPRRADIIIGGAAILLTILEELNIEGLYATDRTLRDGMLVDYLKQTGHAHLFEETSARQRSVINLAKKCGVDEEHYRQVQKLALQLFDSGKKIKLHNLKKKCRQYLEYASILHDVGIFLSYSDHHRHSYYLIKNAELVGFNQNEIDILAAIAYFHRKKTPKKSRPQMRQMSKKDRNIVKINSTFLRIAEALDRSHQGVIKKAKFSRDKNGMISLKLTCENDCQLELWRLNSHNKLFRKIFKQQFAIKVSQTKDKFEPQITGE